MLDLHSPKTRRRILALDGGGIRGVFTLEILARMEELLRQHTGRPDLVLADHFDLIAGTSTGAIIAAFLSWGEPVARVRELYLSESVRMFVRASWWKLRMGLFDERNLTDFLQRTFVEDDQTPALLGTEKLKTLLLLVMRNASTGSAWPVSNNPAAAFNFRHHPDGQPNQECNLNLPLWRLVRASAAAPVYFPPETLQLGASCFEFIDGGITAYNNPALIAFLTATLPCYKIEWSAGTDRLHLVSVGTGQTRVRINERLRRYLSMLSFAFTVPAGLMDSISREQDLLCRALGECLFGADIDTEIGDLKKQSASLWQKAFTYARYNREFTALEIRDVEQKFGGRFSLDNIRLIQFLRESGRAYSGHVRLEHLL